MRRLLGAHACGPGPGRRVVCRNRLVLAVRVTRLGRGQRGSRARGVRDARARRVRRVRRSGGAGHRLPPSIEPRAARWRHRAPNRAAGAAMSPVAVLGAGSWGSALAMHLARAGHATRLWARDAALVAEMQARRANAVYLPDVPFPPGLDATGSIADAVSGADLVVCAVPSHGVRAVMTEAAPALERGATLVSATKGLELDTFLRMSELLDDVLRHAHPIAVISGPSFAAELARQMPTAVCVASVDPAVAERVQAGFRS